MNCPTTQAITFHSGPSSEKCQTRKEKPFKYNGCPEPIQANTSHLKVRFLAQVICVLIRILGLEFRVTRTAQISKQTYHVFVRPLGSRLPAIESILDPLAYLGLWWRGMEP